MIDFDRLVLSPCSSVFGEGVGYFPAAGGGQTQVTGIFDDRYVERTFQDGAEVSERRPVLHARAGQFAAEPVQDELFLIRGRFYAVIAVDPDSFGDLKIGLRHANDAQLALAQSPPLLAAAPA